MRVATALAIALLAPAVASADPPSFATASGNCTGSGQPIVLTFPATSSAHQDALLRVAANGGPADMFNPSLSWDGAATLWARYGSVAANAAPDITIYCNATFPVTASLHDLPSTPVTYSGTSGRTTSGRSQSLYFRAPAAATYVADIAVSGGSIDVCPGSEFSCDKQTFASSGQHNLGQLAAGARSLTVFDHEGPRASFTITLRALPVAVSGLAFAAPYARAGDPLDASFTTDGDTRVDAVVSGAAGDVRTLASTLAVGPGEHRLTWDGRDASGAAVADGTYTLRVSSRDTSDQTSSASATVLIDSTPPGVALTSPSTIGPDDAVTVSVADAGSGIASGTVAADEGDERVTVTAPGTVALNAPADGWSPGAHRLGAQITDKAGNVAAGTIPFTVRRPSGGGGGVATLSLSDAKFYVRRTIRVRFSSHARKRLACRRISRLRFRCHFSAVVGDSSLRGRGPVFYSRDPADDEVHFRYRVRLLDEYCRYVLHAGNCTKRRIWRD